MFSSHDELIVPVNRWKLLGLLAGCVAFVVVGWWLVTDTDGPKAVARIPAGAAAIVFFGAVGVSVLSRLVRRTPALVINRDGIFDDSSATAMGLIRWHEIAAVRPYEVNGQTFLAVVPRDLDALLARQPAWKRKLARANHTVGAEAINIPEVALPMSVAELEREIRARFKVGG